MRRRRCEPGWRCGPAPKPHRPPTNESALRAIAGSRLFVTNHDTPVGDVSTCSGQFLLRPNQQRDALRQVSAHDVHAVLVQIVEVDQTRVAHPGLHLSDQSGPEMGCPRNLRRGADGSNLPLRDADNLDGKLSERAGTRLAALAMGLDPALGIIHTEIRNRDSLALDLLEPLRPLVEQHILELLAVRHFTTNDFHETRQDACRILPRLTHPYRRAKRSFKKKNDGSTRCPRAGSSYVGRRLDDPPQAQEQRLAHLRVWMSTESAAPEPPQKRLVVDQPHLMLTLVIDELHPDMADDPGLWGEGWIILGIKTGLHVLVNEALIPISWRRFDAYKVKVIHFSFIARAATNVNSSRPYAIFVRLDG